MTTTVLADAFKPSDWWEGEKWTDPNAPEDWVRSLQIAIPSTDPDQPIVLEVVAGSFDPHPVVDVLTSDHTGGDLMALLEALPHIINVLYEINEEVDRG
jgi:hypothetical protein